MEILGYNKRCAEFLGWKETTEEFKINWVGCKTKERLDRIDSEYIPILEKNGDVIFPDFSTMDFINDWRWIMEVVDAIEKLNTETSTFEFKIEKRSVIIKEDRNYSFEKGDGGKSSSPMKFNGSWWINGNDRKEAVVNAINQFLIWFNENKNI